jgi:3-oxoacyl-[acyl-carrier protein] reductase
MADLVFIAGASSDLGSSLIRSLLTSGRPLSVIAHFHRSEGPIKDLQGEFGERIYPVQADFSDAASVKAMTGEILKVGVPTQVVFLPALRLTYERLTKFNMERFKQDMAVQVEAPVIFLGQFAQKMSKIAGARIVFVLSSVIHGMPPKFASMYTVVKYAQLGLMRASAAEYAATELTINAVSPGMMETKFLSEIGETAVEMAAKNNPKGRNARPQDVIGAIEFLLSPGSGYMTGADIPVTAGSTC